MNAPEYLEKKLQTKIFFSNLVDVNVNDFQTRICCAKVKVGNEYPLERYRFLLRVTVVLVDLESSCRRRRGY